MNAGLPIWARVLAVVALVVIVGAVWFAMRWLTYDVLPPVIAAMLGAGIMGLAIGFLWGQRSVRKQVEQGRNGASHDWR